MNKNKTRMAVALSALLLMASCGTTKQAQKDSASAVSNNKKTETKATTADTKQASAVNNLAFVQKVYDNQVYAKNIVGKMSFTIQANGKEISVPGKLSMRKNEVIRIQLFIPVLGSEVGRLEFTPNYVLIIDRLHKEYIKADYTQVDFLKKQGVNFYSLQALFWNQLLVPGTKSVAESDLRKFTAHLDTVGDELPVTIQYGNMSYAWTANRSTGRISETNVVYSDKTTGKSKLSMKYSDFKSVGVKQFPATLRLTLSGKVNNKQQEVKMNMEMDHVKTDDKWEAQTEVSSKYKQVQPQDVLGKLMNM